MKMNKKLMIPVLAMVLVVAMAGVALAANYENTFINYFTTLQSTPIHEGDTIVEANTYCKYINSGVRYVGAHYSDYFAGSYDCGGIRVNHQYTAHQQTFHASGDLKIKIRNYYYPSYYIVTQGSFYCN